MQKTLACVSNPTDDRASWNQRVAEAASALSQKFDRCAYAVRDEDVAPAHLLEITQTGHPCDALISLWSDNTYDHPELAQTLSELGDFQLYGVMESTAIPFQFKIGRAEGMCQIAFIRKPKQQRRSAWEAAWLGDHTRIAIDTQSNYAYRQNVIASTLPYGAKSNDWPLMDAIVEENFPAQAMTDREFFFAAEGDPEKFEAHQQTMMQSCARFIDFECFDCVVMSFYVLKA